MSRLSLQGLNNGIFGSNVWPIWIILHFFLCFNVITVCWNYCLLKLLKLLKYCLLKCWNYCMFGSDNPFLIWYQFIGLNIFNLFTGFIQWLCMECSIFCAPFGAAFRCFSSGIKQTDKLSKSEEIFSISQLSINLLILGFTGSLSLYFFNKAGILSFWQI